MTAQVIPVRNDIPAYSMRVDLSGVEFVLSFRFNERDSFWYMDVADQLSAPIRSGMKVVLGMPLMRTCKDLRRPIGDFIAVDQTNAGEEATTQEAFGDRVLLVYTDGT